MMTTNEIMVSIVGVLLGYWIIAAILGDKKPPAAGPANDIPEPGNSADRDATSSQNRRNQRTQDEPFTESPSQAWYKVLAVPRSASLEEVQIAYRALIRQYHPDKVATLGEELRELAERKSKTINQAYNDALAAVGNR